MNYQERVKHCLELINPRIACSYKVHYAHRRAIRANQTGFKISEAVHQ